MNEVTVEDVILLLEKMEKVYITQNGKVLQEVLAPGKIYSYLRNEKVKNISPRVLNYETFLVLEIE